MKGDQAWAQDAKMMDMPSMTTNIQAAFDVGIPLGRLSMVFNNKYIETWGTNCAADWMMA